MLWNLLESRLLQFPDASVYDETRQMTYLEIIKETKRISKLILKNRSGTIYAILCNSEFNTAIALLSLFQIRIPAVLLSMRYGETHCRKILDNIQPSCVIVDNPDIQILSNYHVSVFDVSKGEYIKTVHYQNQDQDVPEDVAAIMSTSGTTGKPKGAMITRDNLVCNLLDIERYFDIRNSDCILIARPLYHAAVMTGEFLISIMKGLDICFYNGDFNPIRMIELIKRHAITVLCATPTLFFHISRIAKRFTEPLPLRIIAISGECMTNSVSEIVREVFPNASIYNVYGLTEASPRVSFLSSDLFDRHPLSIGRPLQSISAKIVDDSGNELPTDINGELIIKAPSVMKGYYQNREETARTIVDGWLHTGDIASKDENGLLYIKCRKDSMLIRAGMNIYPQEIENALKADPRILDALAYGVLDEKVGQRIMLKIVTSDFGISRNSVLEICKQKLPFYQIPDSIHFVDCLEKNGSGKLIRPRCKGGS